MQVAEHGGALSRSSSFRGGQTSQLVNWHSPLITPRRVYNLVVKAAPKIPRSPSFSRCWPKAKKPPRKTIVSSSSKYLNSGSLHEELVSATKVATPDSKKSGHTEFRVVKHDHVISKQPSQEHVLHAMVPHEPVLHALVPHESFPCAQDSHSPAVHAKDLRQHHLPLQDEHEHVLHSQPSQKDVL